MTDPQMREFLLRRLPAGQCARMEDAIMTEDGFAESLREAEFDLLDDYAAGALTDEDREAVEQHLLGTVESLHSLKVARALHRRCAGVDSAEPGPADRPLPDCMPGNTAGASRSKSLRIASAATLLAAGIATLALILPWHGGPDGTDPRTGTASVPAKPSAAATRLGDLSTASLPVVTLVADVVRGAPGSQRTVKIEARATSVRLQAEVPEAEPGALYSLRVEDAAGRRLFEGSELAVRVAGRYRFVEAVVPAAALAPGVRTVSLRASGAVREAPPTFSWHITGLVG